MSKDTVLILGANSDIAQAIAYKFASLKHPLILALRNHERLNAVLSDLKIRYEVDVKTVEFDARDFESHSRFVKGFVKFPMITVCVFGYLGDNEISLQNSDETRKVLETNYNGAVSVLNEVAMRYKTEKSGTIIGISSVAGERGRQSNFLYGSAKAGFSAYLDGLRNYGYHHGFHVVTVKPGFVNTAMTDGISTPKLLTAQPKQVANAVYGAYINKKNTIFTLWMWKYIMLLIRNIPEKVFKKMKM
jgi:short-subunit dehydrogenase